MRKISYTAILAFLFASTGFGQSSIIQTLAGGGVPASTNGGPYQATSASLGYVSGVAVFGGNVYMTLQAYSIVVKMDALGNLSLVAGNGTAGFTGDSGAATSAQLNNPWGIAFDGSGNLYIADSGNNCIRKVSPSGTITTLTLSGGGTIPLLSPTGVAVDTSGNVYIADTGNNVVRRWSNGQAIIVAGVPNGGGLVQPSGVATATALLLSSALSDGMGTGITVDMSGNLYIADYGYNAIRKVTNGALTTPFYQQATATQPGLAPTSVAVDAAGDIFFSSWGFNVVGEVNAAGTTVTVFAGNYNYGDTGDGGPAASATFNTPAAVALDPSGNIYIADYYNYVVREVASGIINTVAGSNQGYVGDNGPATSAILFDPTYTAMGPAGELYIVDSYHNTVRKIVNGVITTVAGTGAPGYIGDGGPATSAQLNFPWGVAVDSAGNLYISDSGNHVIRKISGGIITTVAGVYGTYGYSCDNCTATSSELYYPSGLALDGAGNLYIADYLNNRIREVSNGTITTVAGNGIGGYSVDNVAPTTAELYYPSDVKLDANGNLYIADTGNNLIRIVAGGVINTLAGNPTTRAGTFNGDGPATSAQINAPSGIALDAMGNLYIADTDNSLIRKVSGGVMTTIAGNGIPAYAGDGGPPTSASLNYPAGVSVGPAGQIYIADAGNNLIRATNLVCTFSVTPTSIQASPAGGAFSIAVQTQSGCSWSIAGLPAWATVAGALSNAGPASVSLTVAPDTGASRSATFTVAGVSVAVSQAACTYTISPGGQIFPAAGGSGSIAITTASGCAWSVTNLPAWVTISGAASGSGSGTLNFTVAATTSAQSGTFTVAGNTFTVEQQAGSIPGLSLLGSMPHIAAQENWTTTFTLVNNPNTASQARLSLFGSQQNAGSSDGNPLPISLVFPQQPGVGSLLGASVDNTLAPSASWIVGTAVNASAPVETGSAQLLATGAVSGFAIFHRNTDNQEAVVPLTPATPAPSYLLAFDNTGGIGTAVAIANVSAQAASIHVVVRDDTGAVVGSGAVSLPGNGQTATFLPTDSLFGPMTALKRGTIEFDTPSGGQISVLGIRNTPQTTAGGTVTTLTTVPALANVPTGGGSFAFIASGGDGWQTTFVLVNAGTSAAPATLNFLDPNGAALPLPISYPQMGSTVSTASSITQTLAAGATLLVQSNGAPSLLTGSAQLSTSGNVSGFVIFRHNGQEAVVPMENRNAAAYLLAFDNTGGTATGVAVNTVSSGSQTLSIPMVLRDDTGALLANGNLAVAANGDFAGNLGTTALFPQAAGKRGTIEFDAPSGTQIGVIGIRTPAALTYTSLPALVK